MMICAAIARAVNPHPRTLHAERVEASVPWDVVPGPDGHAESADRIHLVLLREARGVERGHELFLGGRTWSKVVADNAAGNPAAVLTAADGPGRLTIAAWCLDDECTDAKRDALAESVAAQVRPAR